MTEEVVLLFRPLRLELKLGLTLFNLKRGFRGHATLVFITLMVMSSAREVKMGLTYPYPPHTIIQVLTGAKDKEKLGSVKDMGL